MRCITIIAAVEHNTGAIGKNNELLYHIPADLRRFKKLTTDHTIIMGLNTFRSLPNGPLPNRTNIVLVEEIPEEDYENVIWATSIEDALEKASDDNMVYIIGGASVYKQMIDKADKVELTVITPENNVYTENPDAFFPMSDLYELYNEIGIDVEECNKFKFYYNDANNQMFQYEFKTFVRKPEDAIEEVMAETETMEV